MYIKHYVALCVVAMLLTLGACGKKGDLILPPADPVHVTTPGHAP